jgi:hypothetical protein
LDTLFEIFNGNKELFKDLYIYDKYGFEKYPVIQISWGGNFKTLAKIEQRALEILENNQKRLNITCKRANPNGCFEELIQKAYQKYQKEVVILIDEYDKPILNNISNVEIALQMRDFLRGFYEQLKENDRYIKFAFLTGISKFSKASIFSGLNQIEDISLTKRFGEICGYTQEELEYYFKDYLTDVNLEKVKNWYNGYNFLGENVYNPFDILKFVRNDFMFKNYWWESGNPFSLIELLKTKDYFIPNLQNLKTDDSLINSFEIEKLQIESLLFQAGYLTIKKVVDDGFDLEYQLKVPNLEVQISLNKLIARYLSDINDTSMYKNIRNALIKANLDGFKNALTSLFASIPYNNYTKNKIAFYEGYWASLIYCYLSGAGLKLIAEDITNTGRIDLTIIVNNNIYILEFKVKKPRAKSQEPRAMEQIKNKNYHQKYLDNKKDIFFIGIEFDSNNRNICNFEWEEVKIDNK